MPALEMWLRFDNIWFQRMYKVRGMVSPHPITSIMSKCIGILLVGNVEIILWEGTETFNKFLEWWQSLDRNEKYSWTTQSYFKKSSWAIQPCFKPEEQDVQE